MSPKQLALATIGPMLLATGLSATAAEEVITQGIDVDVRQSIDEAPQGQSSPDIGRDVQDLGDGSTNDG